MEEKRSAARAVLRSKILWLFIVGAAAIAALNYEESPERYAPVAKAVIPKGSPIESGVRMPEAAKPGEGERMFSAPELRWVLAQELLLKTMRPLLKSNYAVDRFNMLVKDFNARAGKYRYIDRDMAAIKKETQEKRASIEAEARDTAARWNQL